MANEIVNDLPTGWSKVVRFQRINCRFNKKIDEHEVRKFSRTFSLWRRGTNVGRWASITTSARKPFEDSVDSSSNSHSDLLLPKKFSAGSEVLIPVRNSLFSPLGLLIPFAIIPWLKSVSPLMTKMSTKIRDMVSLLLKISFLKYYPIKLMLKEPCKPDPVCCKPPVCLPFGVNVRQGLGIYQMNLEYTGPSTRINIEAEWSLYAELISYIIVGHPIIWMKTIDNTLVRLVDPWCMNKRGADGAT